MTGGNGPVSGSPQIVAPAVTWRSVLGALGVVIAGAAIVGGLTPYGQRYLPYALTSFANSAGSWTALAFAMVYLSRSRTWLAAVLGATALVVMNEAYGVVSGLWAASTRSTSDSRAPNHRPLSRASCLFFKCRGT